MKYLSIIIISFASCLTYGQDLSSSNSPYMSIDVNIGTRNGTLPTGSGYRETGAGLHLDGALGFMFNPIFGIKGVLAYDQLNASFTDLSISESTFTTSHLFRASLEGVLSIGELVKMSDKGGVNFHAGLGWSTMINKDRSDALGEEYDGGKYLKKNDDMGNVVFGITGLIHLNEKLSLTADFSSILLIGNDYYLGGIEEHIKSTESYQTFSIGVNFRFI